MVRFQLEIVSSLHGKVFLAGGGEAAGVASVRRRFWAPEQRLPCSP